MITFQNKNSYAIENLKEKDQNRSISTLLIPAHLETSLKMRIKENGNRFHVYLKNLLWMYRTFTHSGMIHPPRTLKTEYQEEGLDLKRVNFRPFYADWLELGNLALAFGKSRCWLFVFLLELDLLGFWEILSEFRLDEAVPTSKNLRLEVSLLLRRVSQKFVRSYYVRV
ncbi:MAG: DUF1564 family protein [Leptospiraceae bacterium]|nr:DUF1564 family protein [Leptospiraceae bacterium]